MAGDDGCDVDVAVLGGGPTGLTLAVALALAGVPVACVDGAAVPGGRDLRTTALAPASCRILEALGVWSALSCRAQPIAAIRVADSGSPLFLHFTASDGDGGPLGWIVDNRDLMDALRVRAAELPRLTVRTSATVVAATREGRRLSLALADGDRLRARLLVGADGRESFARRWAGLAVRRWDYRQTALVCALGTANPHDGVALEHFLRGGPLAVLPMTGQRVSIVWSETPDRARWLRSLPAAAFAGEVARWAGDWLGAVELLGERSLWPLAGQLSDRLAGDRVALVGEAAHVLHPVAGQGMNLSFRDVAALAEVVVDARRLGQDVGSVETLERYQSWRRFDILRMASACHGLVRLFSNDVPLLRFGRRVGLAAVHRTEWVKRQFVRQAMGNDENLPKLATGAAL